MVDAVVKEDDILEENVTSLWHSRPLWEDDPNCDTDIEQIEQRRPMNKEMDAIYLLSPLPHIVDCLMADLERRRYRRSHLIWTSCRKPVPVRSTFKALICGG